MKCGARCDAVDSQEGQPTALIRVGLLGFPVLGILAGMAALSIDMYLPAFPAMAEDLAVSQGKIEITLSIFLVGFALGQSLHGPLSDRFGRKPIILWGLVLYGLASVGCALSIELEQLYIARFLQGVVGASGSVLARAVIRDLYQGDALARAMSWLMLVMTAAPMLAPLIGSLMLSLLGWRSIFWTLAGFAFLWFLLVLTLIPETQRQGERLSLHPKALFQAFRQVVKHRRAMGYALTGGFAFAGMFAYITGTPFIYMELYGVSPTGYSILFALNIVAMAVGSLLNTYLIKRVGRDRMIRLLIAILLLAAALLCVNGISGWGEVWGLVLPLALYVGCLGALAANCVAGTLEFFPNISGTASSVFGTLQFGLGSVGGALTAFLNNGTVMPMVLVIMATASVAFILYQRMVVSD